MWSVWHVRVRWHKFFSVFLFGCVRVARRTKDSSFFFRLLLGFFLFISSRFYQKLDVFAEIFLCMIYVLRCVWGVFIRFLV